MATAFISYSHKDLLVARTIHDAFIANGLECWRDEKWIAFGDDFVVEITKAIRECDAFVVLLSAASNSSDYVSREVAVAHYFHKPIFPVLLDTSDLSDSLLLHVIRLQKWDLKKRSASELAAQLKNKLGSTKGGKASLDIPGGPQFYFFFPSEPERGASAMLQLIQDTVVHLPFVALARGGFRVIGTPPGIFSVEQHMAFCGRHRAVLVTDHMEDCLDDKRQCAKVSCPNGIVGIVFYEGGKLVRFFGVIVRGDAPQIAEWMANTLLSEVRRVGLRNLGGKVHLLKFALATHLSGQLSPLPGYSSEAR